MNGERLFLRLDQIEVPANRLRDADPLRVDELVISLRERGQMTDIEVLPQGSDSQKYLLNVGLHRFMAAPKAGLDGLWSQVFDGTRDEARLREIDENLYRAELNPLDQAVFLAERREIYNRLHGTVAPGRPKKIPANSRQLSFFDDTTNRFGLSRNVIERALTRFNKLAPEVRRLLRGTKTARTASEIDALMRLDRAEQIKVAQALANDEPPKNVRAALALLRGDDRRGLHISKTMTDRLIALWAKASSTERKAFIEHLIQEGAIRGAHVAEKARKRS